MGKGRKLCSDSQPPFRAAGFGSYVGLRISKWSVSSDGLAKMKRFTPVKLLCAPSFVKMIGRGGGAFAGVVEVRLGFRRDSFMAAPKAGSKCAAPSTDLRCTRGEERNPVHGLDAGVVTQKLASCVGAAVGLAQNGILRLTKQSKCWSVSSRDAPRHPSGRDTYIVGGLVCLAVCSLRAARFGLTRPDRDRLTEARGFDTIPSRPGRCSSVGRAHD